MKRWLGYGLLGLLAYGFFMMQQLPAALLVEQLAQRVPGLSIEQAQGSALRGSASGLRRYGAQLETVAWRLRPLALLAGRLEYRFSLHEAELSLTGVIGIGWDRQLTISTLEGHLPLPKAIALAGRPPPPVNGKVELEAVELSLNRDGRPQTAQGRIRLLNTHTSFGRTFVLGDFSAELKTDNPNISAAIEDNGGPLEFTGTLTLTPDGHYRFSGQAAVRDDNRELRQALGLLGRPGGDGTWKIDLSGILQV